MRGVDIDERDGNFIVFFEMPDVREQDIVITGEDQTLNVVAATSVIKTDTEEKKIDIDSVYFDKTVVLSGKADFKKMTYVFFAGCLEVTIPKV